MQVLAILTVSCPALFSSYPVPVTYPFPQSFTVLFLTFSPFLLLVPSLLLMVPPILFLTLTFYSWPFFPAPSPAFLFLALSFLLLILLSFAESLQFCS